jgi:hypothetical protein
MLPRTEKKAIREIDNLIGLLGLVCGTRIVYYRAFHK